VPLVLMQAAFPRLSEARAVGEALFRARLQRLLDAMALAGYVTAALGTLLAGPLIAVLFGAAYEPAAALFAVLIWSAVFFVLSAARAHALVLMERSTAHALAAAIGAALNIALNLVLIPRHGAMGAAAATLLGYWLATHAVSYLVPALRDIAPALTRALLLHALWGRRRETG